METRKIIEFGKSSFVLSIPKSWITRNDLGKGDSVCVDVKPRELIISPKTSDPAEDRKIIIYTKKKSMDLIRTEIFSAYLTNYDTLEIVSEDGLVKPVEIKNIIQNLAGMEILVQTHEKILTKYLLNTDEISIETLMRRTDIITRSMMDDMMGCSDDKVYKDIFQRDHDVNRLTFLAYRTIRKALLHPQLMTHWKTNEVQLLADWEIAMRIEKIADQCKRIARHLCLVKQTPKMKKDLLVLFETTKRSYLDVMKAYYTGNKELAFRVETSAKDRLRKCDNYLKRHHDFETAHIIDNLEAMVSSVRHISRSIISKIES